MSKSEGETAALAEQYTECPIEAALFENILLPRSSSNLANVSRNRVCVCHNQNLFSWRLDLSPPCYENLELLHFTKLRKYSCQAASASPFYQAWHCTNDQQRGSLVGKQINAVFIDQMLLLWERLRITCEVTRGLTIRETFFSVFPWLLFQFYGLFRSNFLPFANWNEKGGFAILFRCVSHVPALAQQSRWQKKWTKIFMTFVTLPAVKRQKCLQHNFFQVLAAIIIRASKMNGVPNDKRHQNHLW